jgi:heptosyltransferase-2
MSNGSELKILLRSPNWLGDCVMALPAISAVRKAYGGAHISVEARPSVAGLYQWCADVDEVITCLPEGGFSNFSVKLDHCKSNAEKKFDIGILFTNSFSTAFFMWKSGVKKRIGTDVNFRKIFLSVPVELTEKIKEAHQAEWYLALAGELEGVDTSLTMPKLQTPKGIEGAKEILGMACSFAEPKGGKGYIILAPGSAYGPAKDWLLERFIALASKIVNETGLTVLVSGTPKDEPVASRIADAAGGKVVCIAGKTNMQSFLALMHGAKAFVGNDSGASHCAAAFGIPTVSIFGSTRPDRTRPLGDKVKYVVSDVECAPCLKRECPLGGADNMACMKSITVDAVWKALGELGVVGEEE